MEFSVARLKSFFQGDESYRKEHDSALFDYIYPALGDLYAEVTLTTEDNTELGARMYALHELAFNILRALTLDLSLSDAQLSLAAGIIFRNIATGLREDLSVDALHANFKADVLKHIADQIWVNRKLFTRDEVVGIHAAFYDNYVEYASVYTAVLGRKQVLHLTSFDATEVTASAQLRDCNAFELAEATALPFLRAAREKEGEAEDFAYHPGSMETFDPELGVTITTKEQLRNAKVQRERQLKLQAVLEREKAKIDAQYEIKIKELNIK